MADRPFPQVKVRRDVACQSSRNGHTPVLIVLHSTEGQNVPKSTKDLAGLATFFDRLPTQASSHVATDSDGYSARMVDDDKKAWTCAFFNGVSLNIEQIGFAAQSKWTDAEQRETARWIALWHRRYDIPIQRGRVMAGGRIKPGVVFHSELGALGGGHHDPGPNYPIGRVLRLARQYAIKQEES